MELIPTAPLATRKSKRTAGGYILLPPLEDGIPVPPKFISKTNFLVGMKPGQSFLSPWPDSHTYVAMKDACQLHPKLGMEFTCRKTPDGQMRVWKIK